MKAARSITTFFFAHCQRLGYCALFIASLSLWGTHHVTAQQERLTAGVSIGGLVERGLKHSFNAGRQEATQAAAEKLVKEAAELAKLNQAEATRQAVTKYEEALRLWRASGDQQAELKLYEPLVSALNKISEYRKAIDCLNQALKLARELNHKESEASFVSSLGGTHASIGDLKQALAYHEQALTLFRQLGNREREAATISALGSVHNRLGQKPLALELAQQALAMQRELKNRRGEAEALSTLGELSNGQGHWQKALDSWEPAIGIFKELNDEKSLTIALYNMGGVYTNLGDAVKAIELRTESLAISRRIGFKQAEAFNLMGLGFIYNRQGQQQQALDVYRQSLPTFRAIGDRRGEAIALGKIAEALNLLGERQQSLSQQLEGLKLIRELKEPAIEGLALYTLGTIYVGLEDYPRAQENLEQALQIATQTNNRPEEASTLRNLGMVYERQGELAKALASFQRALELSQKLGFRFSEAASLVGAGGIAFLQGDLPKAEAYLKPALEIARSLNQIQAEANALFRLAQVSHARGSLAEARQYIQASQALTEARRGAVINPNLRASFLAEVQSRYEFQVDLWLDSHRAEPAANFEAEALLISEQSRARSLVDLLTEARADIRAGLDAAALASESELRQKLNAKAAQHTALLNRKHTESELVALTRELNELTARLEEAETAIRRQNPRYASLVQPQPLRLAEIQKELLDEDTILLEYALGYQHSYVWVVTPTTIQSFALPKRAEIESAARRVYELLSVRQTAANLTPASESIAPNNLKLAAERLSQMLLAPVAAKLGKKRLLIVAPAALQYIPFAVLPEPNATGQPLLANHEIVNLPSASVLSVLRREFASRKPTTKTVAIFADPVFSSEDARARTALAGGKQASGNTDTALSAKLDVDLSESAATLQRAVRSVTGDLTGNGRAGLQRLLFSRDEAEAIAAVAPAGSVLKALDFQASRATALSDKLANYRIIHFATHGLLDSAHPELSGLALSLVDENGQSQDGYLRLNEIYNLKLNADLVVLSACQTGLGKEVKGEGLIGLTRGFMYAGAPRVVASLWQVNDAATAELMKRFYRGMLKEKLRPAAALRQAQLELMKKPAWSAPYYWGAFVLQGEWK